MYKYESSNVCSKTFKATRTIQLVEMKCFSLLILVLAVLFASSAQQGRSTSQRGSHRWGLKLGHPVAETGPAQVKPDQQPDKEDLLQDDLFRVHKKPGSKKSTPRLTVKNSSPGEKDCNSSEEGSGSNSSESIEEKDSPVLKTQSDLANRNAFYHFQSVVKDGIKGGQVERHETRQGLKVTGSYSYTDGYVRRTVEYEADDKGYRIIKETVTKIGDGPKENKQGIAKVETEAFGRKNLYTVSGKDLNSQWRTNPTVKNNFKLATLTSKLSKQTRS